MSTSHSLTARSDSGARAGSDVRDIRSERRKLAARLARQIEDDIAASGWQVGTVFGTEPELTQRYGASRSVLLEAVRLVEHHQVAVMRRGPKGGLVVREPDLHGAATALAIYLDHIGTSVVDLMDVRLMLEPLAVRLVATAPSKDTIAALREAADEEVALEYDALVQLPDRVHELIADHCGNAVLELFLEVLSKLNLLFANPPRRTTRARAAAILDRVRDEHRDLVGAITDGAPRVAAKVAEDHLAGMRELMLAMRQKRRSRAKGLGWLPNGTGRYAEVLAERIRVDIANDEAAVGDIVGSETDLRERYGVSRQVLREAVRLLEHHGVAKMRRGPGGGLVVTEPDPWASIEAVAVYLDYQQIDAEDLGTVFAAIELAALERVIARRTDPAVALRLRATTDVEALYAGGADVVLGPSLHRELAVLSGNPVLEVFFLILTSLWQRHILRRQQTSPLDDHDQIRDAGHAHDGIVDAILAGKTALARRRTIEHLGAIASPFRAQSR
jgi:DNA-binding FadR family transcriptional regulator